MKATADLPDSIVRNGNVEIPPVRIDCEEIWRDRSTDEMDFEDVKGQEHAKRAIQVAAASGPNGLTLQGI